MRSAGSLKGAAAGAAAGAATAATASGASEPAVYISKAPSPTEWDPSRPTPYDVDAT